MKKTIKDAASNAASGKGILSANVSLNGNNPILALSIITLVAVGAYTVKQFVDKATVKVMEGDKA